MADMIDFSNVMDQIDTLRPLNEFIESVMSLPDDSLDDNMIDSLKGMITGAFTPRVQAESVQDMQNSFSDQGLTRSQAVKIITEAKHEIRAFVDELKPSTQKRALLEGMFDILFNIYDTAVEKYHNYNIELPMTLAPGAYAPTYAHDTDGAADIYALTDMTLAPHSLSNKIPTGLCIALPEGWSALILPRSSMGAKTGLRLSNSIGLIDSDYRGEIGVLYDNISDSEYEIKAGDRIAQMLVVPSYKFKARVVEQLSDTERGTGGFGSSGK